MGGSCNKACTSRSHALDDRDFSLRVDLGLLAALVKQALGKAKSSKRTLKYEKRM